jgi:hypothetical protein
MATVGRLTSELLGASDAASEAWTPILSLY